MTRNGKIARLPHSIRELLNRRLRDGEQGVKLLKWLNGLPEVQEVLAEDFGGRPINEQNLSEWKQGGFNDWLRHQDTREWVRALADESGDLEEDAGDLSVADWLSAPLAVALGRWIHELAAGAQNDAGQRKELLAVARELAELRRSDHGAERLRIDRERWEDEQQEKHNKEIEKLRGEAEAAEAYVSFVMPEVKRRHEAKVKAGTVSPDDEEEFQALLAQVAKLERSSEAWRTPRIAPPVGDQTESNSIKPNQTNANKTR
jgi:hypothetical protein